MFASRGPRARRLLDRGAAIFGEMIQSCLVGRGRRGRRRGRGGNGFLLVGGGDWLVGNSRTVGGASGKWIGVMMDWNVLSRICYIASRAYRDLAISISFGRVLFVRVLVALHLPPKQLRLEPSQVSPYRT